MKKIIQITLTFALILGLTSCFDIIEEIKMNNDGSGELKLTIDLSQSKGNLANYMQAGEINGVEIPTKDEVKLEIMKLKQALGKIKGISNIKTKSDFNEFIFEVNGDFANVKALNKAINVSAKSFNQTPFPIKNYKHFDFTDNKFSRLFEYTDERFTETEYNNFSAVVRYLMESAKVVSIYRFEKPIKKVTNKKANLSPSKKAVKLEGNIAEFAKGEKSLENHISF